MHPERQHEIINGAIANIFGGMGMHQCPRHCSIYVKILLMRIYATYFGILERDKLLSKQCLFSKKLCFIDTECHHLFVRECLPAVQICDLLKMFVKMLYTDKTCDMVI